MFQMRTWRLWRAGAPRCASMFSGWGAFFAQKRRRHNFTRLSRAAPPSETLHAGAALHARRRAMSESEDAWLLKVAARGAAARQARRPRRKHDVFGALERTVSYAQAYWPA